MTQTEHPSIESMNTLIHDWMGVKRMKPPFQHEWIGQQKVRDLKYHSSWDELHGAWSKVDKNIDGSVWPKYKHFVTAFYDQMASAMVTSNITTAHKILYDAILWIKNNEG